ncbi:MAG: ergothioneine biosynthesis protein EgtB [Rubripirellula sp.]
MATTTDQLLDTYRSIRGFTEAIAAPLSSEDCCIQSMDDVSPTRWHMAHTTWFFETFLLRNQPGYKVFDESFNVLFNSYYNTIGKQYPREQRGLLSRPSFGQVQQYRSYVDEHLTAQLQDTQFAESNRGLMEIGLNHEQQHQELILTDIKHVLSCNPSFPTYRESNWPQSSTAANDWISIDEGVYEIGHAGDSFAFDNESPRHKVYLHECEISSRLVTCGEYLQFIEQGGYQNPDHWLSLGWATVNENQWNAPLYWHDTTEGRKQFTLAGLVNVDPHQPVTHLSYFEADAYARWRGMRLPTEFEWETACMTAVAQGKTTAYSFVDQLVATGSVVHPSQDALPEQSIDSDSAPTGLMGSAWQWTSSSYAPYPGYRQPVGAVGEYNGKFMCNQYVLRGGSVATSRSHIRPTYRNFFPADTRWQFSGLRLAR